MKPESISSLTNAYQNRFKVKPPYFEEIPQADLSLIITIPSYKEPNITDTLESLSQCHQPKGTVELIIGINAPENTDPTITKVNHQTIQQIEKWQRLAPKYFKVMVVREESIPTKLAGAGFARKLIMDEALHRWAALNKDGPIVCLDADCKVSPNYLLELEGAFTDLNINLGHLHFEHPYQDELDPTLRAGIINYELHLRCYIHGLKSAGYPYAIHTVGSCMAVRASTYAKGGGMNSRKAGEDFHFLHKLVQHGGWKYLNKATVFPSSRVSDRVPFGTGKAQIDYQNTLTRSTYNPEIYSTLAQLFKALDNLFFHEIDLNNFPVPVHDFLTREGAEYKIQKMKMLSNSKEMFAKRWWQWMDGLKVLKLVHYLRDHGFPNVPVVNAAQTLQPQGELQRTAGPADLLKQFRRMDKSE